MHLSVDHRSISSHHSSIIHRRNSQRLGCLALTLVILGACSTRQAYYAMQESQRTQCQTRPPTQQAECLADTRITFEEYQRRRAEAMRK